MTASTAQLALVRPVLVRREHADRATYRAWVWRHIESSSVRSNRLRVFEEFSERWPRLQDWFNAPLRKRLFDQDGCVRGRHPHGGASVVMPYLSYLSLVHGIGLDYELLLARTFASPFTDCVHNGGLGVDVELFQRHVGRLIQLGYSPTGARQQLKWPLGRMLLHRGDPDLNALTMADLDELRQAIDAFTSRQRLEPVRDFYARSPGGKPPKDSAGAYFATAIARLHSAHVLLFHTGQVDRPPSGRIDPGTWVDNLAPRGTPPQIRAVIERYLRLHLDANLDRPQTVRHSRDALRRLVEWLSGAHPEITNLSQLHRVHAEEFLRWFGEQLNQHTGEPLALTTRRSVITLLMRFVNETAAWQWNDVPGRVLFTRGDIPKVAKTLPRFIPDHELAALMSAVDQLPDPYQRAALIVARWSGARRDEIRRLAADCLDTYPDGHPRLRIPVGKGHTERSIPLHPQAAEALQPLIELAHQHAARRRFDPSAGHAVQHVFLLRGKLLSNAFLFELSLKTACGAAGLLDSQGRPTITAHRFRHTIGTQLAEGGARLQTIMAVLGHRTPQMSLIYASLSDPTVKQQYQDALDRHVGADVTLAGPAAEALREHRLDPDAVHWLETNFLKTELELGHCLRLPQEGPCECDLVLTCSKFLTTSDYAPRLQRRLATEEVLIADATERGWDRVAATAGRTTPSTSSYSAGCATTPAPVPTPPGAPPKGCPSPRSSDASSAMSPARLHRPHRPQSRRSIPHSPRDVNGGLTMTTGPARCIYALRPAERPGCQFAATITYGEMALCSACDAQRSTLGKGQVGRRLPGTESNPIDLLADARIHLIDAQEQLQAAVIRARQHHTTWAAIARVLGTTRQAAQQRFTQP